jgi:EmrB/QacA subfamily drug resistance transporter
VDNKSSSSQTVDGTQQSWQGNGRSGGAQSWGPDQQAQEEPRVTGGKLWAIMISVMLGILLAALDQTIVGPALPQIVADLNGFEQYAWVVTIYLLTSTIAVPIAGKLSDLFGRKWLYLSGIVVFLIGSMLSGLSQDIFQLIAFRGIQGIGAGILFGNAFAIVADLIPPRDRGRWQGLFGGVWGLASVIGPTIGGWLTDGPGWRWVFFVNVPIGLAAMGVLLAFFPNDRRHVEGRSVDWLGAGALIAGLTPLLLALSLGGSNTALTVPFIGTITDWSWGSPTIIALLAVSVIFLGAFLVIEARAKEPIIPLNLFRNSIFTWSVITVFVTGIGLFGAILYIPLFIQAIQGDTATNSGNAVTPMTLAVVVASVISGQIVSRTGKYRLIGIAGMALGTLGMFLLYTMNMDTERLVTITYMVILGFGMGITFPLYTLIVQNAFPMGQVGVVTAAVQFFRSIGSTVGVAILGSVVNNQFHQQFPEELAKQVSTLPPQAVNNLPLDRLIERLSNANPQVLVSAEGIAQLKAQLAQSGIPTQFVDGVVNLITEAMKPALFTGIQEAFLIGTVMLGIGLVTTMFIKEIALRGTNWRAGPAMAEGGVLAEAEEAGKEMAASGMPGASNIPASDEPELVVRRQ